jgi:hypothetical protein
LAATQVPGQRYAEQDGQPGDGAEQYGMSFTHDSAAPVRAPSDRHWSTGTDRHINTTPKAIGGHH